MATQMDFNDEDTDSVSSSPPQGTANGVLQILKEITTAAQSLAKTLPSVNKVLLMIENEQEEMDERARQAYKHTDQLVQIQLSRLKLEFQSCTTKAKLFVYACVSMAKYGTNEEIKQILDRELQKKKIDSLQEFIKDVLKQLKLSSKRFDQFKNAHCEVQDKATLVMKEYKQKALASQNGVSNGYWGVGVLAAAGVRYLQDIRNAGTSYFRNKEMGTEVDPPKTNPEQEIFRRAQVCVADLAKSMDRVTHQINEIEAHTAQARDNIDNLGEKCLDAHTDESLSDLLIANIRSDLGSFRDAMRKILDITGNDGERISNDPHQVISNTVAAQVSEEGEEGMNGQNPMDINLHTTTYTRVLPIGAEFVGPHLVAGTRLHHIPDTGGGHSLEEQEVNQEVTHQEEQEVHSLQGDHEQSENDISTEIQTQSTAVLSAC